MVVSLFTATREISGPTRYYNYNFPVAPAAAFAAFKAKRRKAKRPFHNQT